MEVVDIENKDTWKKIVQMFNQQDIYFTNEYNAALMLHGDGRPQLIFFEKKNVRIAYVMFLNDIAMCKEFQGILDKGRYYDWTAPYGYGGPLTDGQVTHDVLEQFKLELFEYCATHHIVSQFLRFHPLLCNHGIFADICELKCIKKTVAIDVQDDVGIDRNMVSECRNRVRKAVKNGVEILWDKGERVDDFLRIYIKTMQFHQAEEFYYFSKEYFEYLIENMKDQIIFFYAQKDEIIISAGVFFYNDVYMHYYLGGTELDGRKYAPFNLLLNTAAHWANRNGIRVLHLGGGINEEDSLYRFKRNFYPNGVLDFYIGRTIFDQGVFDELVQLREQQDSTFCEETSFMIKYRKPIKHAFEKML